MLTYYALQALDMYGNWAGKGGEKFELHASRLTRNAHGNNGNLSYTDVAVTYNVVDQGDGSYVVAYVLPEASQVHRHLSHHPALTTHLSLPTIHHPSLTTHLSRPTSNYASLTTHI